MPRHCAAAGCSSVSGKRYRLHEFPRDDALRANLMGIGCKTAANWLERTYIRTTASFLCRKHFEASCFVTGVRYRNTVGIPAKKRLKPNAIPTIFLNPLIVTVNQLRHPKDLLPKGVNVKQ